MNALRIAILAGALLAPAFPQVATAQQPAGQAPIQTLMEEVHLLHQLHRLRPSTPQLRSLREALGEIDKVRASIESRHDTPEIRSALTALRKALQEGREPQELEPLFERLEGLRAQFRNEGEEPEQQVHAAVRRAARTLLQALRPEQVVRLVGEEGEGEDGLAQHLARELAEVRRAPEAQRRAWASERSLRLSLELTDDTTRAGKARAELLALFQGTLAGAGVETPEAQGKFATEFGAIVSRAVGSPLGELQLRAERRLQDLLRHPRMGALVAETLRLRGAEKQ